MIITLLIAVACVAPAFAQEPGVYELDSVPVFKVTDEAKDRAAELVSKMTLDEKLSYIGGYKNFYIRPIERLGIPEIRMADGPQGVRNDTRSTMYPSGIAAASTWNRELIFRMGEGLGQDARARGVHILLGPGVNIYRSPLCGRNFEYFGEDPFLASETAVAYIKGVQSQGVMACVKHFALNNEEWDRHYVSSDADERTMSEIYFPTFEKAVKNAGVGAVMTSYNLVNSTHSSENRWMNVDVLRGKWGFEGLVMSDWTSTYSVIPLVYGGLDLEMPQGFYFNSEGIAPIVENGVVDERYIDEKVQHILQTLIAFGFFDRPQLDSSINEKNPFSDETALDVSRQSAVLLKNDASTLPLKKGRVALYGPFADRIVTGGGSGFVDPMQTKTIAEAMSSLGGKLKTSVVPDSLGTAADESVAAQLSAADAVVVCIGFDSSTEKENSDRTFALPEIQAKYLQTAITLNDNVIVVLFGGGSIEMASWLPKVKAVLMVWYPGQEGGLAIAEILTGKISPSGKLPISIETALEDNPSYAHYYAAPVKSKRNKSFSRVAYDDGIFVGYRGYDRSGTRPLFPFGYGLSYSSFEYSDLAVAEDGDDFVLSFKVRNTGPVDAYETAQVYVHDCESTLVRPQKELKGYEKVFLKAGETKNVVIRLDGTEAFRYYDNWLRDFVVEPGDYEILVGSSSDDIRLSTSITLD